MRATIGLQWDVEGEMAHTLAVIDTDIAQAMQVTSIETESQDRTDK